MKAFDLTGHGTLVPVSGLSASTRVNAYAVVDHNSHTLCLTLINSGHERATITLNPRKQYVHAESMLLSAPNGNLAATTGVTLGGSGISGSGQWNGHWSRQTLHHGHLRVMLQPETALLLKLPLSK
jgi:hypothetical protein